MGDGWSDIVFAAPGQSITGTLIHTGPPSLNYISTNGFFDYPQTVALVVTCNGVEILNTQSIIAGCVPGPVTCIGDKIFFALPECSASTIVVNASSGGHGTANPLTSMPQGQLFPVDVLYEPPMFSQMQWGDPTITGPGPAAIYKRKSGAYFLVFDASSIHGVTLYNGPSINCRARVANNDFNDQWRVKVSIYTVVPGDGSTLLDVTGTDADRDMNFTVPNTSCVQKNIYVELFSTSSLTDVTFDFTAR